MTSTRKARTPGAIPVSAEQIEREAVRLFSEKTYPAVGMRDISDSVGLLPGSLYVHIRSKESVLFKIVRRGVGNYLDGLRPIATSNASGCARLHQMISKYMEILDANLELSRVAMFQWTYLGEPSRSEIIELRTQYEALFTRVISDGIAAREFSTPQHPRVVVLSVIGLLNSTLHWYSHQGSDLPEQIAGQLSDLVLRGLS